MIRLVTACFIALLATDTLAQMRPGGPPEEAFTACSGVREGEECSFQAPHGEVTGTCRQMREPDLLCVPRWAPGSGPRPGNGRTTGGSRPLAPGQSRPSQPRQNRSRPIRIASRNPNARVTRSHIPDTGQGSCFDDSRSIPCPGPGAAFHGQDAQYLGAQRSYRDNGDGTLTDQVTGLTWQQAHNPVRLGWQAASDACRSLTLGGRDDWRLPEIKELYSIADFAGVTGQRPFLDPLFEIQEPGPEILDNDRFAATHRTDMMGQTWSATRYAGNHWDRPGVEAAFFFNFLDGRIKQAPTKGRSKLFYRCVAGESWGDNTFVDNGDGTVTDRAAGLVWQQSDDGRTRNWQQALDYCENLQLAGHDDWRLPNAKELQSLVDYRYHAPALDREFFRQQDNNGWFWSSTTHGELPDQAIYLCFGKCVSVDGTDVHGAGAQRSDPKRGDPRRYGSGLGGQQDQVRIQNYARCVR